MSLLAAILPTLVITNAHILTLSPKAPLAHCLVIAGERIEQVGNDCARDGAEVIDAHGATIVPGFNDAHVHLGIALVMDDVVKIPALARVRWLDALRAAASRHPYGTLLLAQSTELPSGIDKRNHLDFIDHPVVVISRHGALLNDLALRRLALDRHFPDGFVPGRFVAALLVALAQRIPVAEKLEFARRFLDRARRIGLTSVQLLTDEMPSLLEHLRARGELTLRVRFVPLGYRFDTSLYRPSWRAPDALWNRVDGVKYYHDDLALLPRRELKRILDLALTDHVPLVFHVLGRYALTQLLDAIERATARLPGAGHLFRFDHVDEAKPQDAERIARLGSVVCANPPLIAEWGTSTLGPLRTLERAGVRLCIGTDWIGKSLPRPLEPLENLRLAITHGGHGEQERIGARDALEAYTLGSAYAEGLEASKGSLEPGKLADLVLLSGDPTTVPPQEIPQLRVLMTMVGGRVVYRAAASPL